MLLYPAVLNGVRQRVSYANAYHLISVISPGTPFLHLRLRNSCGICVWQHIIQPFKACAVMDSTGGDMRHITLSF